MSNFIQKFQKIQLPFFAGMHLYFDLGTANTRIAIKDKGIVLRESTYVGYNRKTHEFIFFGDEAKIIVGKTPEFIKIIRPLVNGILSDFDAEVALLNTFIQKAVFPYFSHTSLLKPTFTAMATIPHIATEIEQKAVEESLLKAGCSRVNIVEKPLAAAAGCGFNIFSHEPRFIIDLGAGLIELSIISGGGIVFQKTLKTAGEQMSKLIANYTYLKHGLVLGDKTCEDLKIELLNFEGEDKTMTVRGKSLENGLPKSIRMRTADVKEALLVSFNQIIDAVKEIMENAPPEISDEVFKNGITLVGNMASIKGIDRFFSQELKIETYIPEHFADAVIYGLMSFDKSREDMLRLFGHT